MPPQDGKFDSTMTAAVMNAFDIISSSSGLDLSGVLEGGKKREKRFKSLTAAENILERVEEIGEKLGFQVEEREGGTIGLLRGQVVVSVKVSTVAPSLFLVEVKMMSNDGGEFKLYWEEVRAGPQNIVSFWYDDGSKTGEKSVSLSKATGDTAQHSEESSFLQQGPTNVGTQCLSGCNVSQHPCAASPLSNIC